MNLRPDSGVLLVVMRVSGVVVLCYVSVDLSGKLVEATIVNLGEFKSSV